MVSTVNYGDSFKQLVTGRIAGDDGVLPVMYAASFLDVGVYGIIPQTFNLNLRVPGSGLCELEVD